MLKIGEFSKLSRISIRMLRHYDETGLLRPTEIDRFTGYRYYCEDQLPVAGRIAALLRRSRIVNEHRLEIGATMLDYDSLTVTSDLGVVELPKKEFMLLFKLLSYPNKIFTRRQLMDEIWDMDSESDERTVDVHINRLRDRFRKSEDFEIVTVRGLGYKAVKRE